MDNEQLYKYIHACVVSQPRWLRDLFDAEDIRFAIDPAGTLILECRKGLPVAKVTRARRRIAAYLDKHPADFISWQEPQKKSLN